MINIRKKYKTEIDKMLEDDEISTQEAAFMYGYYAEECY